MTFHYACGYNINGWARASWRVSIDMQPRQRRGSDWPVERDRTRSNKPVRLVIFRSACGHKYRVLQRGIFESLELIEDKDSVLQNRQIQIILL